jgi:transposase
LLPACYVAPVEIRELRRLLRYRNVVVAQAVRMKNKMSGLLMEVGAPYNKQRLHGKQYFSELLDQLEEVPESVKDLLRLSRTTLEAFEATQQQLLARLRQDPLLTARVKLLTGIRGVGTVTALTWVLEVGEPQRFSSIAHAVSYCGLTSALVSSADKQQRGPISKQRNAHLQTVLIEAAKLAPRWNPQLAAVHTRELAGGHRNRATLEVARKLVAYLLAVDKSRQPFQVRAPAAQECETVA